MGATSFTDSLMKGEERATVSIIHGISNNAKKITLLNCYTRGHSHNASVSFPLEKYGCTLFIVGKHLNSINEELFNKITIRTTHLSSWLPPESVHTTFYPNNNGIGISLKENEKPYREEIEISKRHKLLIESTVLYKSDFYKPFIEQYTDFSIQIIHKKSSFDDLLNKVKLFMDFLSLLSLEKVEMIDISLKDNDDFQLCDDGSKYYFFSNLFIHRANNLEESHSDNLLLKHSELKDEFSSIIKDWYKIDDDLSPIRKHLIKSIQIKPKSSNTTEVFLITVQALEGFHRRFICAKRKSLEKRLNNIIAKVLT